MKTLIIDDDPKSHKLLKNLLAEEHVDIEVMASGFDLNEGFDLVISHQPDLLFLDIELPDGLGFDLLKRTSTLFPDLYVIFITAYDKYAITAIRFGALDFLVKPIDREELFFALQKARQLQKQKISQDQIQLLLEAYQKAQNKELPSRLALASQSDVSYIEVEDIIRLQAKEVYTVFHLNGDEKSIISSTNLGKYVEQFRLYREFVQVHRSHMINLRYVKKYRRGDQTILMKDGSEVGLSRSFLEVFKRGMREL
jgi:two-component system LytT family response regulator